MLHIVHLLQRRSPRHAGRIAAVVLAMSACAALAGLALSLART